MAVVHALHLLIVQLFVQLLAIEEHQKETRFVKQSSTEDVNPVPLDASTSCWLVQCMGSPGIFFMVDAIVDIFINLL